MSYATYMERPPVYEERPTQSKMDFWSKLIFFLLIGFSVWGRSFSYLGIPQAKIFIGDITLGLFILFRSRTVFDRWVYSLMHPVADTYFGWLYLFSLLFGTFELLRGLGLGYSTLTALENYVFVVYPLYFFIGIYTAARNPKILLKAVRVIAWLSLFYGPLYLLFLHKVTTVIPGTTVGIFPQAGGGSFILLAILCLEPRPQRMWLPLLGAAFLLLAVQVRAEWVGFTLSMIVWGILGKKMDRVLIAAALVLGLLAIGYVTDFSMPSTSERGGEISTREIVGRAVAAVNPDAATDVTSASNAAFYAGTISWRKKWWHAIWDAVHENRTTTMIGFGYGYPLGNLVQYLRGQDIRTPHSIFYYNLGYTGWIGVLLFFSMQLSLAWILWVVYRRTRQPLGLALWVSSVAIASFGTFFESPFGAIPFYLILGFCAAPGLVAQPEEEPDLMPARYAQPQFTTAGRY